MKNKQYSDPRASTLAGVRDAQVGPVYLQIAGRDLIKISVENKSMNQFDLIGGACAYQPTVSPFELAMTSLEIAELVGSRHDKVKQSIERLAERGVIALPPMGVKVTAGRPAAYYVFEGEQGKRDSIIAVAQLSPEFTARLVDRWQELERSRQSQPLTQLEILARMATEAAISERKMMALQQQVNGVEQKIEEISSGSIPAGWETVRNLSAKSGISNQKIRDLVSAFAVPNKKVPFMAPNGILTNVTVIEECEFDGAMRTLLDESTPPKKGKYWQHPAIGRFEIRRGAE
ncbi:Rha family transcriptional regulator [Serratia marcescens]|uniref:Rha family transcriptional regulator n=2 Tax=Serratia marcescens TaxID=615 RepID=UPI000668081F|nr:Rha family transcriptional regulator [Serratia marcescens]EHT9828755.1 Rha family transcriptional regulator [Serratia marcescens]EIU0969582.1 Rha family transcriptional regulator [Serratia marcescens]MDP8727405.1 Rha family transcriptional regulator [Serratia marcescens]